MMDQLAQLDQLVYRESQEGEDLAERKAVRELLDLLDRKV